MPITPLLERLPADIQCVLDLIDTSIMTFDRLRLWVDHPAPDLPPTLLEGHGVSSRTMPNRSKTYDPVWQTAIDVYQPTPGWLRTLGEIVGARYRVQLSYVELAIDWLTGTDQDAKHIADFMLAHLRVPNLPYAVSFFRDTMYFGPRETQAGTKAPRNVVMYADRPSKHVDRPCCHLEWRLQGPSALGNVGLFSLDDCASFNHRKFWSDYLILRALPSKADLGRWLVPEKSGVSGTALRKRAEQFIERYSHEGAFVLHNCCLDNSGINRILKPIYNGLFLKK